MHVQIAAQAALKPQHILEQFYPLSAELSRPRRSATEVGRKEMWISSSRALLLRYPPGTFQLVELEENPYYGSGNNRKF